MRRFAFSLLGATALLACSNEPTSPLLLTRDLPLAEGTSLGEQFVRKVGLGWVEADTQHVTVPARVRRGVPFTVRVAVTLGGCTGSDTTVAAVSGQTATIVPYISEPTQEALAYISCLAMVRSDVRSPSIVFNETGDARVRVIVRGGPKNELLVVERRVTVQP